MCIRDRLPTRHARLGGGHTGHCRARRPRRPGRGGMIRLMVKDSQLAAGETVVFTAHSHWKNIVVPVLVTGVVAAAAVAGLLVLVFGIWPIIVWLASTDTLTTRRLISRRGVFSREGKDIPIDRVQSVSYRRTLLERMLGCGTLVVQTSGPRGCRSRASARAGCAG